MEENEWLAKQFEVHRTHLQEMAYHMLGSLSEAEDAVQEAWLHLSRSDASQVENLGGWLTTVVAHVCLDMLRSRKSRHEQSLDALAPERVASPQEKANPEREALLADSVGLALLVVLERLSPAERVAFVLHDLFALPFDEIAPILERSPSATRQLASRARRRVRGETRVPGPDLTRQRELVEAFLAASRQGDFEALLALLDADVVVRADRAAVPAGAPSEVHGAQTVARQALFFARRSKFAQFALVNGAVGILVAPRGRLNLVMAFKIASGKIVEIEVIADPARLHQLELGILEG